jgi:hypothetical protein
MIQTPEHSPTPFLQERQRWGKAYLFLLTLSLVDAVTVNLQGNLSPELRVLAMLSVWLSAALDQSSTTWALRQNPTASEKHEDWQGKEDQLANLPLFDPLVRSGLSGASIGALNLKDGSKVDLKIPLLGQMALAALFPVTALPLVALRTKESVQNYLVGKKGSHQE